MNYVNYPIHLTSKMHSMCWKTNRWIPLVHLTFLINEIKFTIILRKISIKMFEKRRTFLIVYGTLIHFHGHPSNVTIRWVSEALLGWPCKFEVVPTCSKPVASERSCKMTKQGKSSSKYHLIPIPDWTSYKTIDQF